jgi:hypothetical protein
VTNCLHLLGPATGMARSACLIEDEDDPSMISLLVWGGVWGERRDCEN